MAANEKTPTEEVNRMETETTEIPENWEARNVGRSRSRSRSENRKSQSSEKEEGKKGKEKNPKKEEERATTNPTEEMEMEERPAWRRKQRKTTEQGSSSSR
jgi:hypothetical protein